MFLLCEVCVGTGMREAWSARDKNDP